MSSGFEPIPIPKPQRTKNTTAEKARTGEQDEFSRWRNNTHGACGEEFLGYLDRHHISESSLRRRRPVIAKFKKRKASKHHRKDQKKVLKPTHRSER
jgi:hypothetical protein